MSPEGPDVAEAVIQSPEVVVEAAPEQPPPKRRGRPPGSKNKKSKKRSKGGRKQKGKQEKPAFDPTKFATGEYAHVSQIPSNVVFVGLRNIPGKWVHPEYGNLPDQTGEILPGLRMRRVLPNGKVCMDRLCEVVKTTEGSYASTKILPPIWYMFPEKVDQDRRRSHEPCHYDIVGYKVIEVLPFTPYRLGQLAYLFVKLLLSSKGINLARPTHRQFGQWASAIGVSIDELKAAARPLVRKMQAEAFATRLDDCQSIANVESPITQERTYELAFLFVKWLLRNYGLRISARGTEGQLRQWAEAMGMPVDELKAALRPLVEEVEAEVFTPKK